MTLKRFVDKVLNKMSWKFVIPSLAEKRKKLLKRTDFTIISNNCWGGRVYEYFNLPKQSPTVGLYFYAKDYVRFCTNLEYYLSQNLDFITADESVHKEDLYRKNEQDVIIGKLNDVEIIFLHYHDRNLILQKWQRRIKRINWDRIILKFSYQNDCSDEDIRNFMSINKYPKIVFSGKTIDGCDDVLIYPRSNGKETIDETENIDRYFNLVDLLNSRI